ncbi:thioesterase family protein [Mycolicibacterium lutetiense]|uniref:Acyl-coenzyme A thioesterase PaaI-like protein n=1 Tax=Mycolicibacterium lutetiense TaxID=1641992 RepID=A0ABS4ZSX6_9MYCO|nr:thioesterase family protein [Mycolicibacterium lutetiense]MBP2452281.1 acyl-coenzyme A thioesterase PaaI-like protein [Mycolicibacterium lutetiense]
MELTATTPFFVSSDDGFVPNEIAHGGWGPTLGGQVVGGLLARAVEALVTDKDLQPARFTVEILRRVAGAPVRVTASVVRAGSRMQAVDAAMTQDGELVARASALYLRRGAQPEGEFWSTSVDLPPLPEEPADFDDDVPMFIRPSGPDPEWTGEGFPWQQCGPRYAWLREVRELVAGEELTPFVRTALAVDVTSSMGNFSSAGLAFINADYTLALSRLPVGPYIGMAALTHTSAEGVATCSACLYDTSGPIGTGLSTAIANFNFSPNGSG